jgi:hypothetical protein
MKGTHDGSNSHYPTTPPERPTVEGTVEQYTVTVSVATFQQVEITVSSGENTLATIQVSKEGWMKRSGFRRVAEKLAGLSDLEFNDVRSALGDARFQVLMRQDWRTFASPSLDGGKLPKYGRLRALTDPEEYPAIEDYPTTGELRDRLHEEITQAVQERSHSVICAPTGSGKSYTASTMEWLAKSDITDNKQVVLLSPSKNARDDAAEKSEKAGVTSIVLKGRHEACPIARGDNDEEITVDGTPASKWLDRMCNIKGIGFSEAHVRLAEENDQGHGQLPCCDGDGKCPAVSQWDEVRTSLSDDEDDVSEYDVIHCTHQFAFASSLRRGTNLLFDERPDFVEIGPGNVCGGRGSDGLNHDHVWDAVTAFLKEAEAPIRTAEELVSVAKQDAIGKHQRDLVEEFSSLYQAFDHRPPRDWFFDHPNAHTRAKAFTKALWNAARKESDANGRRVGESWYVNETRSTKQRDPDTPPRERINLVLNETNTITTLRVIPILNNARSVIGLDAYPVEELWQLNVGDSMTVQRLMSERERRLWRRFERRLVVIEMGRGTYSYTSAKNFKPNSNQVVIDTLRARYGSYIRTAIAPDAVEEPVTEMLVDAGVDDPETMHHGDVESRNDFKGETIGVVLGCIDPGDDYVLDQLAELDYDAQPERTDEDCDACQGKGCTRCDGSGKQRAFGRGFVGQDAEKAVNILASVRENQVAQAIGRYAREADDPDDWAVVFARTDAIPDSLVDFPGPVAKVYGKKHRAALQYISEHGKATIKEIVDWIAEEHDEIESCTKEHVRDLLKNLEDQSTVSVDKGAGYYGADLYKWNGAASTIGYLDFEVEGVSRREETDVRGRGSVEHSMHAD